MPLVSVSVFSFFKARGKVGGGEGRGSESWMGNTYKFPPLDFIYMRVLLCCLPIVNDQSE